MFPRRISLAVRATPRDFSTVHHATRANAVLVREFRLASAANNRRAVNEIENDGRVHCGHYGGESGSCPVKNETLRGADNGGKVYTRAHAAHGCLSTRPNAHRALFLTVLPFVSLSPLRSEFRAKNLNVFFTLTHSLIHPLTHTRTHTHTLSLSLSRCYFLRLTS